MFSKTHGFSITPSAFDLYSPYLYFAHTAQPQTKTMIPFLAQAINFPCLNAISAGKFLNSADFIAAFAVYTWAEKTFLLSRFLGVCVCERVHKNAKRGKK